MTTSLLLISAFASSLQEEPKCGGHCLFVALDALDRAVPRYGELDSRLGPPPPAGYSLVDLANAAEGYGLHSLAVKTSLDNLRRRQGRFACIALFSKGHYVLIADVDESGAAVVVDPPVPVGMPMPPEILASQWNGTALLLSREPLVPEEDLTPSNSWPVFAGVAVAAGFAVVAIVWWFQNR